MRFARLLLVCFILQSLYAQDAEPKYSLFGCSEGAVETSVTKKPTLHFVQLDHSPDDVSYYGNEHRFVFHGAQPFDTVYIYFTATLGEAGVGRGSRAKLGVYAEFANSSDGAHSSRNQWWKIEPTKPGADKGFSSESLTFDAEPIRSCFEQESECHFGDVALATPDANVGLVAIKFSENLGGANANNWTEASLLLDFRQSPPLVLATADCGYNEGGGACTAIDSGEAARSDLRCAWKRENRDFLCSQESSPPGLEHRDFYLLSDEVAPLRSDEVASLEDAIRQMRAKDKHALVKVRGIGPVAWIDEIGAKSGEKMIILGSDEYFYIFREDSGGLRPPIKVEAHAAIDDDQPALAGESAPETRGWTLDLGPTFHARAIVNDPRLTVVQVLAHENPASRQLYWIGVDASGRADAVQLVGGGSYAGCGRTLVPASVIEIGKIAQPFAATVRLEPATMSSADGESLSWLPNEEDESATDCIRSGQITWKDGRFHGTMDGGACAAPQSPKYVRVDDAGKITLTDKLLP